MADTKITEQVVQEEDNDVVKESQRVMKIKVFITVAAIILLVLVAILFWDSGEGYFIKISTDEGQSWTYEIADTSTIEGTGTSFEKGKFKCNFNGLKEGETEIVMYRINDNDPQTVLEKRVYHVQVMDNLSVIQKSVDREFYEE